MKKKVIISLSGGMDSATLIAYLLNSSFDVSSVSFFYGSKHGKYECECAKKIAKFYGIDNCILDLSFFMMQFSSHLLKRGGEIPEGHYSNLSMTKTIVPMRNIIFASILSGIAMSKKYDYVSLGVHAGDHAIYPDCRPDFCKSLDLSIYLSSDKSIHLLTPFLYMNKTEILKWGLSHNVPYNITRTCYKDQEIACGKCGSCNERLEAFKLCQIIDPLNYE